MIRTVEEIRDAIIDWFHSECSHASAVFIEVGQFSLKGTSVDIFMADFCGPISHERLVGHIEESTYIMTDTKTDAAITFYDDHVYCKYDREESFSSEILTWLLEATWTDITHPEMDFYGKVFID